MLMLNFREDKGDAPIVNSIGLCSGFCLARLTALWIFLPRLPLDLLEWQPGTLHSSCRPFVIFSMYLMYYIDAEGNRNYTMEVPLFLCVYSSYMTRQKAERNLGLQSTIL